MDCKLCGKQAQPRYRLRDCIVFACPFCDFHAIPHLDGIPEADREATGATVHALEKELQHNARKFTEQATLCERLGTNLRVLDVGCGGGAFLKIMRSRGHEVHGIELAPESRAYCRAHGLAVSGEPIEKWTRGEFDVVTLWDVIEHVNDPRSIIEAAIRQIRPGGALIIDTPSRDSLFYRFGELTYRTFGRPTLLASMYSPMPYAHKQIFTDAQLAGLMRECGCPEVSLSRKFELSFPIASYLLQFTSSQAIAKALAPLASLAVEILRVRNKVIAVGHKMPVQDPALLM